MVQNLGFRVYSVFSGDKMCSLTIECVLLPQNAFPVTLTMIAVCKSRSCWSDYRMCSLTINVLCSLTINVV